MGEFLEIEKIRQAQLKKNSCFFSEQARDDGVYKGKARPFCLPDQYAQQNLFPLIRESAVSFFAEQGIKWHDEQNGNPSNHLCDSQVCCVNFLFPFSDNPKALTELLRIVFPEIKKMIPVECGRYVSFEWIGIKNYLGERIIRGNPRTRGANFTSADAIVMFERNDNKRQIVLIEWKYTESYSGRFLKYSDRGTDRTGIYQHLFEQPGCPVNKNILPGFDSLFYEPFYQLMRQQFLAAEMEKANELGADIVTVLHIAPAHNKDFVRVTSPALKKLGKSVMRVWEKLAVPSSRFSSITTETLFGRICSEPLDALKSWSDYIKSRYNWVCE